MVPGGQRVRVVGALHPQPVLQQLAVLDDRLGGTPGLSDPLGHGGSLVEGVGAVCVVGGDEFCDDGVAFLDGATCVLVLVEVDQRVGKPPSSRGGEGLETGHPRISGGRHGAESCGAEVDDLSEGVDGGLEVVVGFGFPRQVVAGGCVEQGQVNQGWDACAAVGSVLGGEAVEFVMHGLEGEVSSAQPAQGVGVGPDEPGPADGGGLGPIVGCLKQRVSRIHDHPPLESQLHQFGYPIWLGGLLGAVDEHPEGGFPE